MGLSLSCVLFYLNGGLGVCEVRECENCISYRQLSQNNLGKPSYGECLLSELSLVNDGLNMVLRHSAVRGNNSCDLWRSKRERES